MHSVLSFSVAAHACLQRPVTDNGCAGASTRKRHAQAVAAQGTPDLNLEQQKHVDDTAKQLRHVQAFVEW